MQLKYRNLVLKSQLNLEGERYYTFPMEMVHVYCDLVAMYNNYMLVLASSPIKNDKTIPVQGLNNETHAKQNIDHCEF